MTDHTPHPSAQADAATEAPGTSGDDRSATITADPPARPSGFFHSRAWLFGEMLVGAIISLVASFVLSIDAVELAANPDAVLSCDINAVVSCGTVGLAWQAELFGFPNAFLGLISESVVITVAVLGLAGMRFPRWFMITAQSVYLLGLIFAYWLLYQSMFNIGALCPWCLSITAATTLVFLSMLHWNILEDLLPWPRRAQAAAMTLVRSGGFGILTALWFVVLFGAIVAKYGSDLFG
ncbi:membrane protein [Paraoerskovia sediminicola]|uniref:Membrane protein n=1 Tax=Paraoerskovia sediminicola TaxID=1138587 RepID=A0ABM8FZE1_9CELL|nr:vitamin K epoxide reductase family protein [Paraoerskovia sediminicola]BDZ40992.1 membrane protein [Paraoerskovia sediminicola]